MKKAAASHCPFLRRKEIARCVYVSIVVFIGTALYTNRNLVAACVIGQGHASATSRQSIPCTTTVRTYRADAARRSGKLRSGVARRGGAAAAAAAAGV